MSWAMMRRTQGCRGAGEGGPSNLKVEPLNTTHIKQNLNMTHLHAVTPRGQKRVLDTGNLSVGAGNQT